MDYINLNGIILKAIGGFYYVETTNGVFECKARGAFRNSGESPLVGDTVTIEVISDDKAVVETILKRNNELIRPPIANLDKLFIVASIIEPAPSHIVIDKLIAVCEYKKITPVILITKSDLSNSDDFENIYKNAGFEVITVYDDEDKNFEKIYNLMKNSICAFAGNTGVGKSTLLNNLFPHLDLQTGIISQKLGRGKHTTRHVELYKIDELNAYIADTPGFGTMDIQRYEVILKDELELCFREFSPYLGRCKFTGCSHTVEKGCEILNALKDGQIENSRHSSYIEMYNQAKEIKQWEINKKQ